MHLRYVFLVMALSSTVPGKPDDGDGIPSYKLDRFRIGEAKATFKEENGSFFSPASADPEWLHWL
jgi:hypothetical protein